MLSTLRLRVTVHLRVLLLDPRRNIGTVVTGTPIECRCTRRYCPGPLGFTIENAIFLRGRHLEIQKKGLHDLVSLTDLDQVLSFAREGSKRKRSMGRGLDPPILVCLDGDVPRREIVW